MLVDEVLSQASALWEIVQGMKKFPSFEAFKKKIFTLFGRTP